MSQDHYRTEEPQQADEITPDPSRKSRGKFFSVDRWTWGKLCDCANINEATAYLVLAQGTGRDNRATRWSATSLKTYAGISWDRANAAISGLITKHFLRASDISTKAKPRYELLSVQEISEAECAK